MVTVGMGVFVWGEEGSVKHSRTPAGSNLSCIQTCGIPVLLGLMMRRATVLQRGPAVSPHRQR